MSPTRALAAVLPILALHVGCTAGDRTSATMPPFSDVAITPAAMGIAGAWTLHLDPASLTAELAPRRLGSAQPPQNLAYQLDIADFLAPRDLQILRVRRGLGDALEVVWRHRHPFPAPNPAAPITAKNRADLSFTGYLVLIDGTASAPYFGGSVTAMQPGVIAPDAYVPVGDLRSPAVPESQVFPAWLLVDEERDSRDDVSNNGVMTGSYDAGAGGWQLSNLGAQGTGWTGYDYLHGGQSSTGTLRFHLPATGGAIDVTVALLAKWTDPRGQGGMTRRMPPDPAVVSDFAYRLPYAALDASQWIVPGAIEMDASGGQDVTFGVALRDWDANASPAAGTSLGNESDVSLVQAGGNGIPQVEFSFPPLGGDQLLTPQGGSGEPRDPLRYDLSFDVAATTPGVDVALVRAIDPEDDDPQANTYRFGVEPGTLVPSADRALPIRTYQVIRTIAANPSGELLFATQAAGLTAGGEARLVQLLPGPASVVPGSAGTAFGTAMAELLSPMAGQFLIVSPAGVLSALERTSEALRTARPLQDAAYAHPSAAWAPVSAYPATQPFLAVGGTGAPPQLVIGDFITGLQQAAFPALPRPLPGLTVSGESLFADLGGPDWSPGDTGLAAVALGNGISAQAALPPLTANGNIYTFDPGNPGGTFSKLTNISDSSTNEGVFYPDWDPDGSRLVCTRVQVNILNLPASFRLALCDATTGNLSNLNLSGMGTPPAPANAYIPIHPVFNRDGTKIAFAALEVSLSAQTVSDSDIWVYDFSAPGNPLTNVSNTNGLFEAYPVFR